MPDPTNITPAVGASPPRPAAHPMIREALREADSPKFLFSLFDLPDGEHFEPLDTSAIPSGPLSADPWLAPIFAQIQVETGDKGRWAWLCYALRPTEEGEAAYFVATLDHRGLRAAWRDNDGEPQSDDDGFAELTVDGVPHADHAREFLERLGLSALAE